MNKQATPTKTETQKPTTTEKNKTNLGKRKKSEPDNSDGSDDLDSGIMSEPKKKIQKFTHSNSIDEEI